MGNISEYFKLIKEHNRQILGPFVQIQNQVQEYVRKIGEPLKIMQDFLQQFNERTKAIFEALEKSKNSDVKAFAWMIGHGWPPLIHVPLNTPTKLMNHCVENKMDKKSIRKFLDKVIIKYHSNDMIKNVILSHWGDSLVSNNRLRILRSAVEAHFDKKYDLSVPVLLSQLEGIPSEYFNYSYTSIEKYKELFVSADKASKDELMELVFQYMRSVIFAGISNNDNKLMEINRHKILHGIYVNYGKESVSLKLILTIDILITYPKFVSLPRAKVYHLPHCPSYKKALKNNKKKQRMIHTQFSASVSGLKPCKRCLKTVESKDV